MSAANCIRSALAQLDEVDETLEVDVADPGATEGWTPDTPLTAVQHARLKISFAIQDLQSALKMIGD